MRVLDKAALLYWPMDKLAGGICAESQKEELEKEIRELEEKLRDREDALPAHSVRPHQLLIIEELETAIEETQGALHDSQVGCTL